VTGLLVLGEGGLSGGRLIAASVGAVGGRTSTDSILPREAPLERQRWEGIVIHHLGRPAGDAPSVHRLHQSYGYQGLGYHFLIGNGCGLGDGIIHVGYRWNRQQPGAHIARSAEHEQYLNERTIGICLIGNGDRRPFTDKQMRSLVSLVRRLQRELGLPRGRVYQHRELAPTVSDPGRFFAVARFEEQLLD
jgi:N-acetyl-anhydromuramyl-L-alanine amidase AmpD